MYISLGTSQQSLVPVSIKLGRLNQLFLRSSGSEVDFGEHVDFLALEIPPPTGCLKSVEVCC